MNVNVVSRAEVSPVIGTELFYGPYYLVGM